MIQQLLETQALKHFSLLPACLLAVYNEYWTFHFCLNCNKQFSLYGVILFRFLKKVVLIGAVAHTSIQAVARPTKNLVPI
jgi:hypothetical protein